jgi:hypothetical protein
MAHFARLENNVVTEVIAVHNNEVLNEAIGISFCKSLYGENTEWVQTSYNATMRGKFAALGDTWDGVNFVTPLVEEEAE